MERGVGARGRPAVTLLISTGRLASRRDAIAAGGSLSGVADGLRVELEPLLGRDIYLPDAKALLSREGGRCRVDGSVLEFDPFSPRRHRCAVCSATYDGELHHRAWITHYHLWLAERALHSAMFANLGGDPRHPALARDILLAYADQYLTYPNVDNVLGPTRPFFSTYLESVWLLQVCIAADLLARAGDAATAARVVEAIVEPSRALIAAFDEGGSNRQVWNNAALLAAALLTRDPSVGRLLDGPSGIESHLDAALLDDGSWYEGENYHQFALRGLWYGVALAEASEIPIPPRLVERFHRAFRVPFLTALPDFTMPSRKDSQYAVSLRQWRLAELAELGYARTEGRDHVLRNALACCYEAGHARRDTGRARSTADIERNTPSGALTRADLGWRGLLFALPELPDVDVTPQRSVLLGAQGLAVFRREEDVYVGFDYGQSGGGHGHADRLSLTLYEGPVRWLDDLGTGSYVDPSLHWYRSTLAHNAPLVNGRSQPLTDGTLLAFEEREGMGWISARLELPDHAVRLERTVVVAPDYLLDELRWESDSDETRVELPFHLGGTVSPPLQPAVLDGSDMLEDGFPFVGDVQAGEVAAGMPVTLRATCAGRTLRATVLSSQAATIYSATAPGQPATTRRPLHVVRIRGRNGVIRGAITWRDYVGEVALSEASISVGHVTGERHIHTRVDGGWHVDLLAGDARSSIDLGGLQPPPPAARSTPHSPPPPPRLELRNHLTFELGRDHYRRSEQSWEEAGAPRATLDLTRQNRALILTLRVEAGDPLFQNADAMNTLDNEHPDTMGAGVQLYLRTQVSQGAWTLVPEQGGRVRVRIVGQATAHGPSATWEPLGKGYALRIELPLDAGDHSPHVDLDLIVNETVEGRVRRRGQLVLTGARNEWVYLRGDRHDDNRWVRVVLA